MIAVLVKISTLKQAIFVQFTLSINTFGFLVSLIQSHSDQ